MESPCLLTLCILKLLAAGVCSGGSEALNFSWGSSAPLPSYYGILIVPYHCSFCFISLPWLWTKDSVDYHSARSMMADGYIRLRGNLWFVSSTPIPSFILNLVCCIFFVSLNCVTLCICSVPSTIYLTELHCVFTSSLG